MYTVKRFHCDYCNLTRANKTQMAQHEKICIRNPESKSCGTCENLTYATERGEHKTVPVCRLAKFDPGKITERNPCGMRTGCPFHKTDPGKA